MEFRIDLSDVYIAIELSPRFKTSNSLIYPINFYLQHCVLHLLYVCYKLPYLNMNSTGNNLNSRIQCR
jgi:hypothetical protein